MLWKKKNEQKDFMAVQNEQVIASSGLIKPLSTSIKPLNESIMSFSDSIRLLRTEDYVEPVKVHSENAKYTLDASTGRQFDIPEHGMVNLYRVVAVRDIPKWGVKSGDVGGWVEDPEILSHDGNAWIAGEAKVLWGIHVENDALIKDNAVVMRKPGNGGWICYVKDEARISGDAQVISCEEVSGEASIGGNARVAFSEIKDNASVLENATVVKCVISGDSIVKGDAHADTAVIADMTIIEGMSKVLKNCTFKGINHLKGKAIVGPGEEIINQSVSGTNIVPMKTPVGNRKGEKISKEYEEWNASVDAVIKRISEKHNLNVEVEPAEKAKKNIPVVETLGETLRRKNINVPVQNNALLVDAVTTIESEYNSYSHDIVKLIQYPLMTDPTFEPVGKFLQKLRKAKRHMDAKAVSPLTEEMVDDLEMAYLAMEAACIKESTRNLDNGEKKKLATASTMVQLALSESSNEHEKSSSAKKALDYLEGIVLLPEQAVESFRVQAGLKELTA